MYACIIICVALIAACIFLCKYISVKHNPSLYEVNDTRIKDIHIIVSKIIQKLDLYDESDEDEKHKYYVSTDEIRDTFDNIYYITEENE